MEQKKKVLLLGGTGAMGVYLAPELISLGYQVYVTSRSERTSNERDLIFVKGNAKDSAFLRPLLDQKFDAIVDFMVYNTKEFQERHLELLDSTPHYLFLSSYRVYGDNHGKPITEESPRLLDSVEDPEYLATDEYGLTKARQENMLRASGRSNWTILRPAVTYSKERFQLGTMEAHEFLQRALKGKGVIFAKQMLDKQATMSWAGDVARLIARMVLNPQAMSEAFTVSTAEHHTWREVMNYYVEILNMKVKIVDLAVYQDVIGRPYQIKYDRMLDRIIDNSKALRVTGMRQEDFMPLRDGLKIELTNFAVNPQYRGYNEKREMKMDALTTSKTEVLIAKIKAKLRPLANKLKKAKQLHKEKRLLKKVVGKTLSVLGLEKLKNKLKKAIQLQKKKKLLPAVKAKIRNKLGIKTKQQNNAKKANSAQQRKIAEAQKYDGAIVTLSGAYNYGSLVQRWALQNFLRKNGYRFKLFNFLFMQGLGRNIGDRTKMEEFIKNSLDTEFFDPEKAKHYKSFVVGSDQVWRDFFGNWDQFGLFFLSFLGEKKAKRIGYGISFGFDKWSGPYKVPAQRKLISSYVRKFDAVSVREQSGIELVKQLGNTALQVLDPTLLMEASDYSALIDASKYAKEKTPSLFYYILDMHDEKMDVIKQIGEKLDLEYHGIVPSDKQPLAAPEVWLKSFRDAKFIVTDSFHGMVFSILNHKPFFVFAHKARGVARMVELLNLLGIENRIIYDGIFEPEYLEQSIDWEMVEQKRASLKKFSSEWLLTNLKKDIQ